MLVSFYKSKTAAATTTCQYFLRDPVSLTNKRTAEILASISCGTLSALTKQHSASISWLYVGVGDPYFRRRRKKSPFSRRRCTHRKYVFVFFKGEPFKSSRWIGVWWLHFMGEQLLFIYCSWVHFFSSSFYPLNCETVTRDQKEFHEQFEMNCARSH